MQASGVLAVTPRSVVLCAPVPPNTWNYQYNTSITLYNTFMTLCDSLLSFVLLCAPVRMYPCACALIFCVCVCVSVYVCVFNCMCVDWWHITFNSTHTRTPGGRNSRVWVLWWVFWRKGKSGCSLWTNSDWSGLILLPSPPPPPPPPHSM